LQERRFATIVPIALAVGTMFIGGFPAVALFALALLVPYVGWRVLEDAIVRWPAERWRGATTPLAGGVRAGIGVALGGLLAAAVVLPFNAHLGTLDLGWRAQGANAHLPLA